MKSFHDVVTLARVRRLLVASISVLTLGGSAPASAQTAPPVQGTIALQATMKKVYQAANVVIVTTIDGLERVGPEGRSLLPNDIHTMTPED